MSYQIYYDRQFIKIDDKRFIPVTLDGANNCTQFDAFTGREKRERNFRCNNYFAKNTITTKEELEQVIEDMRKGYQKSYKDYTDDSFCSYSSSELRGRKGSYNAFKSFYLGGIKTAKTVEELKEHYMSVEISVYGGYHNEHFENCRKIDMSMTVETTEELVEFLAKAKEYYKETPISFSVCIDGDERSLKRMRKSERIVKQKERVEVDHFFVVNINETGYVYKCTSRGIRYSPYSTGGKRYRSEAEVLRRVKALSKRYASYKFSPVRVDEPATFLV